MTADRIHNDKAARIAHEIEARLHHGERAPSVIHDELHKLQKLDSHHGIVHHNEFEHDVQRVEHKVHKDGFLPNLHIRVDHQSHVHLENKKQHAADHKSTHQHPLDRKQHPEPHQPMDRKHNLEPHQPSDRKHSPEHMRDSSQAVEPKSKQIQEKDRSLELPPVKYPQTQKYEAPMPLPRGQENFAPLPNPDSQIRPGEQQYTAPPFYTDPYRGPAPLRDPRLDGPPLRDPRMDSIPYRDPRIDPNPRFDPRLDSGPLRDPRMDSIPYRDPRIDPNPRFDPRLDSGPLRDPRMDSIPYRDPRMDQPGPYRDPRMDSIPRFDSGVAPGQERFDNRIGQNDRETSPIITEGSFRELRLDNRVSNHAGADALVYVRKDFDPTKPVHLAVYNHGFGSTVSSALDKNQIKEMMSHAQPNTVLVLPEWQANPGTRSGNSGNFGQQDKFTNMVQEMMSKTPALRGATLANVDRIDIIAHSAGYSPTEKEIYKNPALASRVHSITLLDSLYDPHGFDPWLRSNIGDLSAGRKQFYNFSNTSTAANSRGQANFVRSLLGASGLSTENYVVDYGNSNGQVGRHSAEMAQKSIVFASTTVRHLEIPGKYIGATLDAINLNQQRRQVRPNQIPMV